jgi:hypothetical protein
VTDLVPEALGPEHDLGPFARGSAALDRWLRRSALHAQAV